VTAVLATLAPVALCAAAGFAWARARRPFDRDAITLLNMEIGAPCLVFSRLAALEVDPAAVAELAGAALLAFLAFGLLGALALRGAGLPLHTFLAPLVFPNNGNLGLPLCWLAFGDAGLALATAFFAVAALTNFSVGPVLWSGRLRPGELARTPVVWAALAAAGVVATGLRVPDWLLHTTRILGDLAVPLMLLTLGVSLAELRVTSVRRAVGVAGLRLALGLGVGLGLATALGLAGTARGVFLLQCAMPAAVFNHLFALRYQRSPDEVASVVVASTLLGFAALPFLLPFFLESAR
jgi:hypothetical protein